MEIKFSFMFTLRYKQSDAVSLKYLPPVSMTQFTAGGVDTGGKYSDG